MRKPIPIACLALLGTAGHAWAEQATETFFTARQKIQRASVSGAHTDDTGACRLSTDNIEQGRHGLNASLAMPPNSNALSRMMAGPLVQNAATLAHTYTTSGIRYQMKL